MRGVVVMVVVVVAVAVVVGHVAAAEVEAEEAAVRRDKRQAGQQGRTVLGGSGPPQRFEKDPVTGQYYAVGNNPGLSPGLTGVLAAAPWLAQYLSPTGVALPLALAPHLTGLTRTNNFMVGRGEPDLMYQECRTPQQQRYGRCRHLEHCLLPEITSYQTFLPHACLIENRFVGVCCPRPGPGIAPGHPPLPGGGGGGGGGGSRPPTSTGGNSNSLSCGVKKPDQTRIVGGSPTPPGSFPWVVSIMRSDNNPNQYCGGALISNRHVLTAAHCIASFDRRNIWARVGEHDFRTDTESQHRNVRIADFRLHESFNPRTFENDIAILVLAQPVQFNSYVRPICLPPAGRSFENVQAKVTGWGALAYQGPVSPVLNEVTLPVWSNDDCDRVYDQPIRSIMLCAGLRQGGKDSCQDDSGGPLMVEQGGRSAVIGIVSFGTRCAEPNKPGVYTRVSAFLDWIRRNMQ